MLGFAPVLVVSMAVSLFAYQTALADQQASDWVNHTQDVIVNARDGVSLIDDMEARYEQYLLTGSSLALSRYDYDVQMANARLDHLAQLTVDNPPQVRRWQVIEAQLEVVDRSTLAVSKRLRSELPAGASPTAELVAAMTVGDAPAGFQAVRDSFNTAIGVEQDLLADRAQQADQDDARLMQVLLNGSLLIIVLGLTSAFVLATGVGNAMTRFARVARNIAAGDLTQRVRLARRDEIAAAADAFDAMTEALQREFAERERVQAETESILNAAADGIYSVGPRGHVTMMNNAAQRMTGYRFEEIRGEFLHALIHHSRADGSPYPAEECPTAETLLNGETQHVRGEVLWRQDGTSFPVDYTSVPICQGRAIKGAVVTFHDITQQLAVERMKDEFISITSHELRTPLTSIRASLGLLASGLLEEQPRRAQRLLELGLTNTDRLIRLVSDILDIERIESGRVPMRLEPHDSRELVQRSTESIANVADAAGVRIVCNAESIPLMVDPDRMVQTLTNLLSNAIKFSERGSEVVVEAQRDDGIALFSVRDSGRGIPSNKLDAIFRRFEQVDASDSRQRGGTGLGLPIARSIVQQHGGKIWVESTFGRGSTFYFTIPLARS